MWLYRSFWRKWNRTHHLLVRQKFNFVRHKPIDGKPCFTKSRSFSCARVVVYNWQFAPPTPDKGATILLSKIDLPISINSSCSSSRGNPFASDWCLGWWGQSWNFGCFLHFFPNKKGNGTLWKFVPPVPLMVQVAEAHIDTFKSQQTNLKYYIPLLINVWKWKYLEN